MVQTLALETVGRTDDGGRVPSVGGGGGGGVGATVSAAHGVYPAPALQRLPS